MHLPVLQSEGTCKPHKLLVQMEPLQTETPTVILTTMCATVKITTPNPFPLGFSTSYFTLLPGFPEARLFRKIQPGLPVNYQYSMCVCVHVLWKCNKMLTQMRQEDSRVNNLYLHDENIVIKWFRGVAPMLISWYHVKYHTKEPNVLDYETCERYAVHNLGHFLSNYFLKLQWS